MINAQDPVARQRQALLELIQLDKSELETSLPRVLRTAAGALDVERVSFWRLSEDRRRITCEQLYRLGAGSFSAGEVLEARQYPRYFSALLERKTIRADDARADPRTSEFNPGYFEPHGITSMLDVPVWHAGGTVGMLCHEHVGPARRWLDSEVDFAVSVAQMIAHALEGQARRYAEARYALLTQAMQDLVWDWDLHTDAIAWNTTALTTLRFDPNEVGGSLQWWKEHVHPDDLPRVLQGLERHIEQAQPGVWRDEYRFRRGDGTWALVADRGVVQHGADGQPLRMVGAIVDVTEQRNLEWQLAVSVRMASVGTLAAGVAHEINNPLTFISGNVSYALQALEQTVMPVGEVTLALREALSGLERVRGIVAELRSFSRPEEGLARVNVAEAIGSALGLARNELHHRARVRQELAPVPPVVGNTARIAQVLLNLLINAAQAIPEGRADANEIVVRTGVVAKTASGGGRVWIEIQDSGVGLSPELQARMFDPFFTTKPVGEGLGLGLSISHSIVTGLGGSLTVANNNPGPGAVARVELPVAPEEPAPRPAAAKAATPAPGRRGRVLIIDDVKNVGITMRRLLADQHEVDVMTRAQDALDALNGGRRWDVILCDVMMPELSGIDFVAELERLDAALVPRVMLMSGGAFTARAQEFLRTWPHVRLDKPIRPEDLIDQVAQAVQNGDRLP